MSIVEAVQRQNAGCCRMYLVVDREGTYADVVARTVEHCLNQMVVGYDDLATRAVECYHWPLTTVALFQPGAITAIITRIDTWLNMNLASVLTPIGREISRHYGWDAYRTSEEQDFPGTVFR